MDEDSGYLADDESSEAEDNRHVDERGYEADDERGFGSDEEDSSQEQDSGGDGPPPGPGGGQINQNIPPAYNAILQAVNTLSEHVGSAYNHVCETIWAAGLIDANAALIAAAGTHAQDMVLQITGLKPSSGFVNESAEAIASRAQALLVVWELIGDNVDAQVAFFTNGFGNDPCIAARLNSVTEYAAQMQGIPKEALAEPTAFNRELIGAISDAHDTYLATSPPAPYGATAFQAWLGLHRPDLTGHADFGSTWGTAKDALQLT